MRDSCCFRMKRDDVSDLITALIETGADVRLVSPSKIRLDLPERHQLRICLGKRIGVLQDRSDRRPVEVDRIVRHVRAVCDLVPDRPVSIYAGNFYSNGLYDGDFGSGYY